MTGFSVKNFQEFVQNRKPYSAVKIVALKSGICENAVFAFVASCFQSPEVIEADDVKMENFNSGASVYVQFVGSYAHNEQDDINATAEKIARFAIANRRHYAQIVLVASFEYYNRLREAFVENVELRFDNFAAIGIDEAHAIERAYTPGKGVDESLEYYGKFEEMTVSEKSSILEETQRKINALKNDERALLAALKVIRDSIVETNLHFQRDYINARLCNYYRIVDALKGSIKKDESDDATN